MVIAELLNKIKDLEKSRRQLHRKVNDNVFILPDLQSGEKPSTLEEQLGELQSIILQIAELKMQLVSTNVTTTIEAPTIGGKVVTLTLMEAIKKIESYRAFETLHSDLATLMDSKNARFFSRGGFGSTGEPVKLSPNFTITAKEMLKKSAEYRDAARQLEQALVKKNWTVEVV